MRARWPRAVILCLAGALIAVAVSQAVKPLPPGMHVASPWCTVPAAAAEFIADVTAADGRGRPAVSQGIFAAVLALVRDARRFIVLDYAAFGAAAAVAPPERRLAAELTDALLARRREIPAPAILFITDPSTERYGTARSPELQLLRAAGVEVVTTDLDRLRDSNPAYSSLWRLGMRWWNAPSGPLGAATRRLNLKANDRKLILADDGRGGIAGVIGSANPTDSESAWSNVAARLQGGPLPALLESELAIARFSGWRGNADAFTTAGQGAPADCATAPATGEGSARVQLLTEGATRAQLLAHLDATAAGDAIEVAVFQLADRGVVESLLAAARRGADVRLILDPNEARSSGGTEGLPNQPVASELVSKSEGAIRVRWYRTHGERFHGALIVTYGPQHAWMTLGSAQLTRRSLDDYNLEANAAIELARSAPLAQQALGYFDTLWTNRAALGIEYTADFAAYANAAQSDYWLYRLLEGGGLAPF
ncbi:MAG TPA: phospholipase D-like domain-containing protein [Steroidobacteraceae bacterium]|nr:phospholipase D-like domain-containing protein [Steroidobacteraceae bacterium]